VKKSKASGCSESERVMFVKMKKEKLGQDGKPLSSPTKGHYHADDLLLAHAMPP
jgi:hypothetical protein